MTELQKRVGTGVLGAAVLLGLVIFGGTIAISFLTAVISLGMIYEFVGMSFSLPDKQEKRNLLMGVAWLVVFISFFIPRVEYELLMVTFLMLFSYFLFTAERHQGGEFPIHFKELIFSFFGIFYLSFLPLYLPLIRDSSNGVHWTLIFLFVNWTGDTAAYFVGKKYGRRKLYPLISPKKTVEGALGGLAGGVIVTLLYKLLFFRSMSWGAALIIPVLVGAAAQVGDLCESFLKRAFDKKDSGSILPGHGGFLDRFDGVVLSLPIMYGCIRILG